MSDNKFQTLLDDIQQFNQEPSLQNLENHSRIVKNPLYKELTKNSIDGCYITNPILKEFLDIVSSKLAGQVLDLMSKKLHERLNSN
ncbi:hypothetical protein [Anaerovorax sp. IOR16]|uniref:hypothetical protein n=1 Tax=Anaerovorax sp. IOR16 TaxID=2773458 RepID=UPI0019D1258A|nr:hypothetical protein [Anaerovorax sp. IOR16]